MNILNCGCGCYPEKEDNTPEEEEVVETEPVAPVVEPEPTTEPEPFVVEPMPEPDGEPIPVTMLEETPVAVPNWPVEVPAEILVR